MPENLEKWHVDLFLTVIYLFKSSNKLIERFVESRHII